MWSVPLRVSCSCLLLRLACLGGGGPVPVPPYLAWGCAPPVGRVRGVRVPWGGLGGGGGLCAAPPVCAAGGASRAGGCSASFRPSSLPGRATKRESLVSFWSWGAWPLIRSGSCSPAFSGRGPCGVLARWRGLACSPWFLWEPAAGAVGRAVLRFLSRAGGGGTIPSASGWWGRAPPRLGGRWGGWCGRGTSRPPCRLLLLRRPPARRLLPVRGPCLAFLACRGPRRGRPRQWRGSPRAAVATPRATSPLSSVAVAALGDAPGSCAGATPRVGGMPGAAVQAAAWLARAAVSAPRASAPPPPGRGGRACCLGGGGGHLGRLRLLGRRPGVGIGRPGLSSRRPDRHRRLRQHPLLALRGGLPRQFRGDGGAGAGPAVVAVVQLGGAIRVRHHCYPGRHAWWQVRPSHYLPVHQCRAVGSAVQCSAEGRGGGGGGPPVASAPYGRGPVAIHRHWEGRRVSHLAHASRHSSQSGAGLRALGPRGSSGCAGGSRTRWTPVTAVTSCVRRKVCTPSRAADAGRGGGVRVLPRRPGWG